MEVLINHVYRSIACCVLRDTSPEYRCAARFYILSWVLTFIGMTLGQQISYLQLSDFPSVDDQGDTIA